MFGLVSLYKEQFKNQLSANRKLLKSEKLISGRSTDHNSNYKIEEGSTLLPEKGCEKAIYACFAMILTTAILSYLNESLLAKICYFLIITVIFIRILMEANRWINIKRYKNKLPLLTAKEFLWRVLVRKGLLND